MPYLLSFLHQSFELPFPLFLFPNNNEYSWRAKYVPRTERYIYGKYMLSDLRPKFDVKINYKQLQNKYRNINNVDMWRIHKE